MIRKSLRRTWLLLPVAMLAQGCGQGDAGPPIHPVSGTVFADGKPAVGAEVGFHPIKKPEDGTPRTMAIVEPDGSFQPSTRRSHDGAPAGDYVLTVVWRKITVVEGEEVSGDDQLFGKYGDPRTSGLKATIKEGDNVLAPIELKITRGSLAPLSPTTKEFRR